MSNPSLVDRPAVKHIIAKISEDLLSRRTGNIPMRCMQYEPKGTTGVAPRRCYMRDAYDFFVTVAAGSGFVGKGAVVPRRDMMNK